MADDYLWDPNATPDQEIQRLEALLRPAAYVPVAMRDGLAPAPRRAMPAWWMMAAAAVLLTVGGATLAWRTAMSPWAVIAERGVPVVRTASGAPAGGKLQRDGVIETDARSVAVLTVGRIGRARLGPGSRLRLLGDDASRHLLALERGTMHASIDAPPRYFLVQTASALAVDLGCVYTLTVDERGDGLLAVDEGEVELQLGDVKVAVLAGNAAALHAGRAPGLPYPSRASDALRSAVAAYDANPSSAALDRVLAAADSASTITLWHLLQRADAVGRARVYERLASIAPPPASVTRERVLRGESGALQRWRTELQRSWATEPSWYRRLWLAVRR